MIYLDDNADEEVELELQKRVMKENSSEGKIDAVIESCDMRRGKIVKRNSEYHSRPPTKKTQYLTCASFEEAFRFPIFRIKLPSLSQLPPIVLTPSEILDLPAIDIDNLQKSKSQI
jgi:hypothetical protein